MTILDSAAQIVDSDRERTYGTPSKNLDTIAGFWTTWLQARGALKEQAMLTFDDVACMMAMLKLARLANNPEHKDSQIDACGYLRLLERCQDAELLARRP